MRNVYYNVGCNGYYTRCNTQESAKAQASLNPNYEIKTCFENIISDKVEPTPIRKAMLEQFGYVHESLKGKVVLANE